MKLAAFVSGGKDSLYAAYLAKQDGHTIECLVTFISENPDSYMFHTPNINLVKLIARCIGVPLLEVPTKGEKEKELEDVKKALKTLGTKIDGIACGAVASKYQMKRIESIAADLGLACVAPLWDRNQLEVVKEEIGAGFDIIFSHVAAAGLDESWLGRRLDASAVADLLELNKKFGVSVVGEGGEFETLVLDCPLYTKGKLEIVDFEKKWDTKARSGTYVVKKAEVIEK
jgi:ABC transporter with metal-binding/Fe-S-binding domain ATP-binding protein